MINACACGTMRMFAMQIAITTIIKIIKIITGVGMFCTSLFLVFFCPCGILFSANKLYALNSDNAYDIARLKQIVVGASCAPYLTADTNKSSVFNVADLLCNNSLLAYNAVGVRGCVNGAKRFGKYGFGKDDEQRGNYYKNEYLDVNGNIEESQHGCNNGRRHKPNGNERGCHCFRKYGYHDERYPKKRHKIHKNLLFRIDIFRIHIYNITFYGKCKE
jgi:hypothetical protein